MNKKTKRFFLSFLILFSLNPLFCRAETFLEGVGLDAASPFLTSTARTVFFSGSALTLTTTLMKPQIEDPLQNYSVAHKPLGSSSSFGDAAGQMIPNVAYTAVMFGHYLITKNKTTLNYASQMFRSSLYSALLSTVLKYSIREPRPNNGNERTSFPSGHASDIFSFATTVAMNHAWYFGVPAYALAGFVGYSRINDNRHYLHDVIGGATIGVSYGLGIYLRDTAMQNEKKSEEIQVKDPKPKTEASIAPILGNDLAGIMVHVDFF